METPFQGKFIKVVTEGRWEYVQRVNSTGALVIIPVTRDEEIIFVQQYRIPLHRDTIEFPAGLIGDTRTNETPEQAARAELLEETGYKAKYIEEVAYGCVSPGLCDECIYIYLATDCVKADKGGGDYTENITVHSVPLSDVEE